MRKLLSFLFLSMIWSNVSFAFALHNLHGIEEFELSVFHENSCGDMDFSEELSINAKYLIGNSKIKLLEATPEILELSIFTSEGKDTALCASYIKIRVFSYGVVSNSVGNEYFHERVSYEKTALAWHFGGTDHVDKHRDAIMRRFDQWIKEFIIEWNESQK